VGLEFRDFPRKSASQPRFIRQKQAVRANFGKSIMREVDDGAQYFSGLILSGNCGNRSNDQFLEISVRRSWL
jgi:hypothetical protein